MAVRTRWYQNVVVIGSAALLVPGAAGFAIMAHNAADRLDECLEYIQQHQHAKRQEQRAVRSDRSGAPDQQQYPSDAREQVGAANNNRAQAPAQCAGLVVVASDAIARASYDLSLLGYFATLFFGALGVLGIFLGFSTARDARDDARHQSAAAASSPVERQREGRFLVPLAILGVLYAGIRRAGSRRLGRR